MNKLSSKIIVLFTILSMLMSISLPSVFAAETGEIEQSIVGELTQPTENIEVSAVTETPIATEVPESNSAEVTAEPNNAVMQSMSYSEPTEDFINYPLNSIVIKKVSAVTGELLAGAVFEVSQVNPSVSGTSGTVIGRYTTDYTGVVVITGLEPGGYIVKEVEPPNGYLLSENSQQQAWLKADGTSIVELTFANYPYGSLLIKKVDETTNAPLSGASFFVTTSAGTAVGTGGGYFTTDYMGSILISNLKPGAYVVREETAPQGYILDSTPKTIHIGTDGGVYTLSFTNKPMGGLLIKKYDSNTRQPLAGAIFRITDTSGAVIGTGDGMYTTDGQGQIYIPGLKPGSYKVVETKAPQGYKLNNNIQTIYISDHKIYTLEFMNEPLSSLTISKMDGDSRSPLAGATIKVTTADDTFVAEQTTDANGKIILSGLQDGYYKVFETKAPNGLLIHLQMPGATQVAGYNSWKNKFERQVKKGEKGIKIFAPVAFKVSEEKEKLDPETNQPILDENGMPVTEQSEKTFARFKVTSVFDVSQTDGKPLPMLAENLAGDVRHYELFMDALREVSPLPIVFEKLKDCDGECRFGENIAINEGMSEIQTVCAVIHEITHAKLHDSQMLADNDEKPKSRRTEEVEAESVSYAVCQYYGIETDINSFGYIAEWSKTHELKELNASLDTIRKSVAELIDGIDERYQALAKERGIDLTISVPQAEQTIELIPDSEPGEQTVMAYTINDDFYFYGEDAKLVAEKLGLQLESKQGIVQGVPYDVLLRVPKDKLDEYADKLLEFNISTGIDGIPKSMLDMEKQLEQATAAKTALIAEYANAKNDLLIGSNVLLMPVFDDLNFNRTGKKIRVKVLEPAGKYQLFSQEKNGDESLYFMTASGRITRTSEYFNSEWDAEKRKHVNHRPTEAELDEIIPKIAEAFEKRLTEPTKWALYQHAAVVNRIDECDAHNIPVRKLREEERAQRQEAVEKEQQAVKQQKQEKYDNRIGEITAAIKEGKTINVAYDQYEFDGKNPVLDLFKLYGISLPLRTQGWVNTGLAEITEDSYRYYKSKHKGNSTTFSGYLKQLRQAVRERPIEQKFDGNKEVDNVMEHNIYKKFAELFPQMANKEYSYMRLEAQGFEPLSLEWIFGDRISIMQTYTMNGDLMYDPMIEFSVNSKAQTMTAVSFEQSMPPLYQRVDENGNGCSIDGNGKEWESPNLQTQINDFAVQWLKNLEEQSHIPIKATLWNDGGIDEVDVRITFDKEGNPIIPEAEPSVDEIEDKFYVDERCGTVTWIYFNPDSSAGGQYVTNQLDFEFIRDAAAETDNAENFFDYIGSECKQYLTDIDTPEFATADRDFKNDPYTFGGCTDETMNALIEMATAKERSEVSITAEPTEASCVLPDPTVSISEMNEYGYTSDDMYPLTESMALELFDSDYTIYMLYDDNTDALVMDRDEIITFCGDGYCGITHEDWQDYLDSHTAQHSEGSLESDLLYGNGDKFGIYQVKDGDDFRDYRFEPSEELNKRGLEIDRKNYDLIYTAPLAADTEPANIFIKFNMNQPEDFTGRSLSMGDVIVFQREGDIQSYYLDRGGYLELPSFTGNERTAEQQTNESTLSQVGTSSQPTVAELEADVKAGKTISLTDLANATHAERKTPAPKGKPSIMERLEANKERARSGGSHTVQKNNELEV